MIYEPHSLLDWVCSKHPIIGFAAIAALFVEQVIAAVCIIYGIIRLSARPLVIGLIMYALVIICWNRVSGKTQAMKNKRKGGEM